LFVAHGREEGFSVEGCRKGYGSGRASRRQLAFTAVVAHASRWLAAGHWPPYAQVAASHWLPASWPQMGRRMNIFIFLLLSVQQ